MTWYKRWLLCGTLCSILAFQPGCHTLAETLIDSAFDAVFDNDDDDDDDDC